MNASTGAVAELLGDCLVAKLRLRDLPLAWRGSLLVSDLKAAEREEWDILDHGRYEVVCTWLEHPVGSAIVPTFGPVSDTTDQGTDSPQHRGWLDLVGKVGLALSDGEVNELAQMVQTEVVRTAEDAWSGDSEDEDEEEIDEDDDDNFDEDEEDFEEDDE